MFLWPCVTTNTKGIVPVPEKIGNGQDPANNLYWGCGYGVKSFLKLKTKDWVYQEALPSGNQMILERVLFKHATKNVYLLADAYDGRNIKECMEDILHMSSGQLPVNITHDERIIAFGGASDLLAYIGHNGLMDTEIDVDLYAASTPKDVILLGCYTKSYFKEHLLKCNANPVLWTTHLMAPEAYTLKAAIDGWLLNETDAQIDERAAQVYHQYQKCGIKGARNLMTTGY